MNNFNIKLIAIPENSSKRTKICLVVADSDSGEAVIEVQMKVIEELIQESNILRKGFLQNEPNIEQKTRALGLKIFKVIFSGNVFKLFNQSLGASENGKLNIRLLLGDVVFNEIHWELMRHKNEFLCFRHTIHRHPFMLRPIIKQTRKTDQIRVLVVATDPVYNDPSTKEEFDAIVSLFRGFGDQIELFTLFQEQATEDNILDLLFGGIDIWHFCGHGVFDSQNPIDSYLIVWPDTKLNPEVLINRSPLYGSISIRMLESLALNQRLGFCFLNACNTARTKDLASIPKDVLDNISRELFVNMAYSLMESGVPIVVATNHDITGVAASALASRFYKSLIKYKRTVDEAVREARAELYILENKRKDIFRGEWSCPILYSRVKDLKLGIEDLLWDKVTTSIDNIDDKLITLPFMSENGGLSMSSDTRDTIEQTP